MVKRPLNINFYSCVLGVFTHSLGCLSKDLSNKALLNGNGNKRADSGKSNNPNIAKVLLHRVVAVELKSI